jgi:hypothetical protein
MQETAWAAVVVRKVRKGLDTVAQELRNMPNRLVLLLSPVYNWFYKCDCSLMRYSFDAISIWLFQFEQAYTTV